MDYTSTLNQIISNQELLIQSLDTVKQLFAIFVCMFAIYFIIDFVRHMFIK